MRYAWLRLKRLPSSPHRIAVGSAMGVFAIFTPFLGGQIIIAALLSWILRGSILASFVISFLGNPLTYPLIWFSTYNVGAILLGDTIHFQLIDLQGRVAALTDAISAGTSDAIASSAKELLPLLKLMIVGSLPLGVLAAGATYISVNRLVRASRKARKRRLLNLQLARLAERGVVS
jgi:uncharacterized protein (DUF2062 family)